jgi:DNA-binding response OmpR family regulator
MSGYTADMIARRGVLEADLAYLAKPFSPDALGAKVRQVLSEKPHKDSKQPKTKTGKT